MKLRQHYKINNNESIILLKIIYHGDHCLIPLVQYEVYHKNRIEKKFGLSIFYNTKIKIYYPSIVDGNNLFKYNQSS